MRLRISTAILAFTLLWGCGKAHQVHAETVRAAHTAVQAWGEFVETTCADYIRHASTEDQAIDRHQQCVSAGQAQHIAVDVVATWALTALHAVEEDRFGLEDILPYVQRLVSLWKETHDVLGEAGMPALPQAVLDLVGVQ